MISAGASRAVTMPPGENRPQKSGSFVRASPTSGWSSCQGHREDHDRVAEHGRIVRPRSAGPPHLPSPIRTGSADGTAWNQ